MSIIQSYVQQDGPVTPTQNTDLVVSNYFDGNLNRMGYSVHEAAKIGSNNGNTASTSYVVYGNWGTLPFTKIGPTSTNLRVQMGWSGYVSPAGIPSFAVSPTNSSADLVAVGVAPFNVASQHQGFTWVVDIVNRAAGSYNFSVWVHSNSTANTIYNDPNDNIWLRITEHY